MSNRPAAWSFVRWAGGFPLYMSYAYAAQLVRCATDEAGASEVRSRLNQNGGERSARHLDAESDPKELAVELLVTSARFTRLAARESATVVPAALWRVLAQLEELGPIRIGDLAAADRISQPTATAVVQKLVERGWAERSGQDGDRRAVRVALTHAGRRVLGRTRDAAAEALLPRLAALDRETLSALAAGVAALARVLAADEPTDAPDGDAAS